MSKRWRWLLVDGKIAQRQENDGTFPFEFRGRARGQLYPSQSVRQPNARVAQKR